MRQIKLICNPHRSIAVNNTMNECDYCGKIYKRVKSFKEHVLWCKVLHESKKETAHVSGQAGGTIPSQLDMWNIVKTLVEKCENLENEITVLKRTYQPRSMKMKIQEFLNTKYTSKELFMDYVKRSSNLLARSDTVERLGTDGYKNVIQQIVEDNFGIAEIGETFSTSGIIYVKEKKAFFIYDTKAHCKSEGGEISGGSGGSGGSAAGAVAYSSGGSSVDTGTTIGTHEEGWIKVPQTHACFDKLYQSITCLLNDVFLTWKMEHKDEIRNSNKFYDNVYTPIASELNSRTDSANKKILQSALRSVLEVSMKD